MTYVQDVRASGSEWATLELIFGCGGFARYGWKSRGPSSYRRNTSEQCLRVRVCRRVKQSGHRPRFDKLPPVHDCCGITYRRNYADVMRHYDNSSATFLAHEP